MNRNKKKKIIKYTLYVITGVFIGGTALSFVASLLF